MLGTLAAAGRQFSNNAAGARELYSMQQSLTSATESRLPAFTVVLLTSLYFSQGLPSGLLAHALPALLRQNQVPLEYIGYLKLLALPWMLKFVWAPWVDRYHFPWTGPHRSWILPMQLLVILLLLTLSQLDPARIFDHYLLPFFVLLLLLNLSSATQDIATDGLAVKLLPSRWRGLGNSIQVSGYKLGLIIGGSLLLLALDRFGWSVSFITLAIMLAVLTLPVLIFREPPDVNEPVTAARGAGPDATGGLTYLWHNNRDFFQQPGIGSWLLVLVSYKLADAMGSAMVKPMLVDLGLSLATIGTLTLVSSITGMAAAVLGGFLYYRWGPRITLPLFGFLQALGIAGFALIAMGYTELHWIYGLSLFEQIADGMSTVALFALMMEQCRTGHEGADYSLQACLQVILGGLVGATSGWLASQLGYQWHFSVCGLLGLLMLFFAWNFLSRHPGLAAGRKAAVTA
jgi:MFS family permease